MSKSKKTGNPVGTPEPVDSGGWIQYFHCIEPLHHGTGQGLGTIDQPIRREVATGLPYIQGSTLKRDLADRSAGEEADAPESRKDWRKRAFGVALARNKDGGHDDSVAAGGVLPVTAGKLLLFPARSLDRLFRWVTSPYVLYRFDRDRKACGLASVAGDLLQAANGLGAGEALTLTGTVGTHLVLEANIATRVVPPGRNELSKQAVEKFLAPLRAEGWFFKELTDSLTLVNDETFADLTRTATEVEPRIKIGTAGVVDNLWTEESLPAETFFYHPLPLAAFDQGIWDGLEKTFDSGDNTTSMTQIAGHKGTGRGICLTWIEPKRRLRPDREETA